MTVTALQAADVAVVDDGKAFTLSNEYITAVVDRVSGDVTSLKVKNLELMGYGSGRHAGYWEQSPARAARLQARVTIDPKGNGGERAEVSVKGYADRKPLAGMICDLEIRYSMGRGDKGEFDRLIWPTLAV